MRAIFLLPLGFILHANAQTYWGTKARWGTLPDISDLPVVLFKYSYGASGVTVIDTVRRAGFPVDVDALACHPGLGLVAWEVTTTGSQMVLLDSTTATVQDFGPYLAGRQIRGSCFDRDHDLLALDHLNDELLHISSADGSVLSAVGLNLGGASFDLPGACDLDQVGDAWCIHSMYTLYQLNLVSGEMLAIFTDNVPDLGDDVVFCTGLPPGIAGIAELPQGGIGQYLAIDGNCEDDIYQYDVLSADSRVEWVHDLIPEFNAGTEDLALAVEPWVASVPAVVEDDGGLSVTLLPGEGLRVTARDRPLTGPLDVFDTTGRTLFAARGNGALSQVLAFPLPRGLLLIRAGTPGPRCVRVLVP